MVSGVKKSASSGALTSAAVTSDRDWPNPLGKIRYAAYLLAVSTMHGQGARPCVCTAVSWAAMPGSTERIFSGHRCIWPAVGVVASVRACLRLSEACPCGFIERHVVTTRAASPRRGSSDTLPLRSRCTLFPHIVPVVYLPCVSHIRRHGDSGIPEDSCRCRHIHWGIRSFPTDVFE